MKDRKRKIAWYQPYDYEGIENFLERMGKKGWKLESIGALFWNFVRIRPADLHYTVVYMPKLSAFDSDTSRIDEFSDYCKSVGWEHAGGKGNFQVYCSSEQEPIAIETDEALKFTSVKSSMLKTCILPHLAILVLFCIGGMHPGKILTNPVGIFGSYLGMSAFAVYIVVFALLIVNVLGFLVWVRRSEKSVKSGGTCAPTGRFRKASIALPVATWLVFAGFLISLLVEQGLGFFAISAGFVLLMLACITGERALIEKLKEAGVSKAMNRLISLGGTFVIVIALAMGFDAVSVMMTDEDAGGADRNAMVLTSHDLVDTGNEEYTYNLDKTSTIFMSKESGTQEISGAEMDSIGEDGDWENSDYYDLEYDILYVKKGWLYDRCLKEWMKDGGEFEWLSDGVSGEYGVYQKVEGLNLKADAAYRYRWIGEMDDFMLLCYRDKIVRVHCWFHTDDDVLEKIDKIVSTAS